MRSRTSFQKPKRRNTAPFLIFLLLSPYVVGFSSPDSATAYSEIMYGIGTGQYVYHDCSGAHKQRFTDAGLYAGKKFEGPYRIGVAASGWVLNGEGLRGFAYPDLALDWQHFSVGTTGIRIGARNAFYFESRLFDQAPLLSGKGSVRFGIGGKLDNPFSNFWVGGNVLPYNRLGLAAQLEFAWSEHTYLFMNGRFGKDNESNFSEFGFSVGMRVIRF